MAFLTVISSPQVSAEFYASNFNLALIITSKLEKLNLVNGYKTFLALASKTFSLILQI